MVAALFVREDSIYKSLGVDCYDILRDARTYSGHYPVICHPPCRAWGRLSQFAKPRPDEKELAIYSVNMVRKLGGVIEHPYGSTLWTEIPLPLPGKIDNYGGFTLCVNQHWFGHKAQKKTLLYIVGCNKRAVPIMPISFNAIEYVVRPAKNGRGAKIISKKEREHTPLLFAKWLIEVAEKCNRN